MGKSAGELATDILNKLEAVSTPRKFVHRREIIAAAIREDRAEPVSEAAFAAAWAAYENPTNIRQDRMDRLRTALEAARKARATADEKGGAR